MAEEEKTNEQKIREYWRDFPEAPASDSFKWIDPQGFNHLTTVRAWTSSTLIKQITNLQVEILGLGGKPDGQQVRAIPQVQATDESGLPVVDADQNPVMIPAPAGQATHHVKGFYHGISMNNKDVLKVVYEGGSKYGIAVFDKPVALKGWEQWPAHNSKETPQLYAPPAGYGHVIIREPDPGEKYPEIVKFTE